MKRLTERTPRDASEVAAGVARMMAALARRAEDGDLEAFGELVRLRTRLHGLTGIAGLALHEQHGWTWDEIGRAAGISRQAAQQRWGG